MLALLVLHHPERNGVTPEIPIAAVISVNPLIDGSNPSREPISQGSIGSFVADSTSGAVRVQ